MSSLSNVGRSLALFLLLVLAAHGCSQDKPSDTAVPADDSAASDAVAAPDDALPELSREDATTAAEEPVPATASVETDWLGNYSGLDLDGAFDAVARGIRYEPYPGVLRGPFGTALARSGNALDQSLLLAEILRRNGYRTRFAKGRLTEENTTIALRGMYPPEIPALDLYDDYAPYDPGADEALRSAAKDHFWVEVFQPGGWLPVDPSFPRATPGQAYAHAQEYFDEIPREYFQTLRVVLKQELRDGTVTELGSFGERVADLGLKPLALSIHQTPKSKAPEEKKKGTGGMFGGLGGSLAGGDAPAPAETVQPERVAVEYQRELFLNGEFSALQNTLVANEDRDGFIRREWLEFHVRIPGSPTIRTERTLFHSGQAREPEPRPVRHYSISIINGPINDQWLEAERSRVGAGLDLEAWKRQLSRARGLEPGSEEASAIALQLKDRGQLAAVAAGHLVGLSYAAESDAMSKRVASVNGLTLLWPVPRILLTTIETESRDSSNAVSTVTLDLRLDRIRPVPFPGFPSRAATVFRAARGLQNTILEGAVISRATGLKSPVTTAVVMIEAASDGTPILSIGRDNAEQLRRIAGLPGHCSALMETALAEGRDVIVPEQAAMVAGSQRWGWWEVDRETGQVIGVMEDGQHQATTNYTLSLSKAGLDDDMGFAIGAITGATGTVFVISGLMLEYGEASAAMIRDVERYVQSIMCSACPSGAGVSAGVSGSVGVGGDCMKWEKKFEAEISAGVKVSFCESYQNGFKCASGMLLQGLRGDKGGASASAGGKIGASGNINCQQGDLGLEVDEGGVKFDGRTVIEG